jgi:small subunit ribosomal protein S15
VYNAPLTNYAADEQPKHFLPGLSAEDQDTLFGALPYASVDIQSKIAQDHGSGVATAGSGQTKYVDPAGGTPYQIAEGIKNEQMLRLLDLRNANKAGIEAVNRQRVIDEFGRKAEGAGLDTGSSEVQGMSFWWN